MSSNNGMATRAHPARSHPLIARLARRLNPRILAYAGSRRLAMFAVVRHHGRRSGRAYATPVSARQTPDGFVISLTFGEQADWFRNVRAAGACVIRWKGVDYSEIEPEIIDWAAARSAFSPLERVLLRLFGIKQFVRLRHAPPNQSDPRLADEAIQPPAKVEVNDGRAL